MSSALETAKIGDELLESLKSWKAAAQALRTSWEKSQGSHFEGLMDETLDEVIPEDHRALLKYAREIAIRGVDARNDLADFPRTPTRPHSSARERVQEATESIWQDARSGQVLLVTRRSDPLLDRVCTVPIAWVPNYTGVDPKLKGEALTG
jgi:hypothetical protein